MERFFWEQQPGGDWVLAGMSPVSSHDGTAVGGVRLRDGRWRPWKVDASSTPRPAGPADGFADLDAAKEALELLVGSRDTGEPDEVAPTLEATLELDDAWGSRRTVSVVWKPVEVPGVDPAHVEAFGPIVAHDRPDDPPIRLRRAKAGHVVVDEILREFLGQKQTYTQFSRVDVPTELVPGTYLIVHDSDD